MRDSEFNRRGLVTEAEMVMAEDDAAHVDTDK